MAAHFVVVYLLFGILFNVDQSVCQNTSFTLAILPDTQFYSDYFMYILQAQVDWIVNCRKTLGIDFVAQLGDLTNKNQAFEWARVVNMVDTLLDAGIPMSLVPGNHDLDAEAVYDTFDKYIPPSIYNNLNLLKGNYPSRSLRNNVIQVFDDNENSIVFIGLEFLYATENTLSIQWLNDTLANYSTSLVIITSHAVVFDCYAYVTTIIADVIRTHCNVILATGGHWFSCDGEATFFMTDGCGKKIPVIISNYQSRSRGGDGWLRYYDFNDNFTSMCAYTYSPVLWEYELDANSYFSVNLVNGTLGEGCPLIKTCEPKFVHPIIFTLGVFANTVSITTLFFWHLLV